MEREPGKRRTAYAPGSFRRSNRAGQARPRAQSFTARARRGCRARGQHRDGHRGNGAARRYACARARERIDKYREGQMMRFLVVLVLATGSGMFFLPVLASAQSGPSQAAQAEAARKFRAYLEKDWKRLIED